MPRLSIISVVLNDRDGLNRTVESVKAQSFGAWELIVKDGGSHDGSAELGRALTREDQRIRCLEGPDDGLYHAMNIALEKACGRWLLFLNAGDCFDHPSSLQSAFECIDQERETPALAFFDTLITGPGRFRRRRRSRSPASVVYGQPAIHQSTLVDATWHRRYPYDHASYPVIADYVAIASMLKAGAHARNYHPILTRFDQNPGSFSVRHQRLARAEFVRAIDTLWKPHRLARTLGQARRLVAMAATRVVLCLSHSSGR